VVGAAGLLASIETLKNGKSLALANKESLVAGGPLFQPLVKKHKGRILPIDSEHSAGAWGIKLLSIPPHW